MTESLISVTEAASRLGVHRATLRRWADRGEIAVTYTAGGHRRFAESEVERFVEARSRTTPKQTMGEWTEAAAVHTRGALASHPHENWMDALSEEARARSREMGRRLMGLLLRYVSVAGSPESMEDEVRSLGIDYGLQSREAGLSLSMSMEATLFFRDALFDSALHAAEEATFTPVHVTRLLRRLNRFVNLVQLSIAETYNAPGHRALSGTQL